jgi:hypothetical protein
MSLACGFTLPPGKFHKAACARLTIPESGSETSVGSQRSVIRLQPQEQTTHTVLSVDDYAALRGDKRIARIQGFEEVVGVGGGFEALKSIAQVPLFKQQRKKEGTNVKPTFCH